MASLAEHLSGPPPALAPTPIAANLSPIGFFFTGLTLFVFSFSVLAYCSLKPNRQ